MEECRDGLASTLCYFYEANIKSANCMCKVHGICLFSWRIADWDVNLLESFVSLAISKMYIYIDEYNLQNSEAVPLPGPVRSLEGRRQIGNFNRWLFQ